MVSKVSLTMHQFALVTFIMVVPLLAVVSVVVVLVISAIVIFSIPIRLGGLHSNIFLLRNQISNLDRNAILTYFSLSSDLGQIPLRFCHLIKNRNFLIQWQRVTVSEKFLFSFWW